MPPTPDRKSIISLSAILGLAILIAIASLIVAPRFFTGQLRGSYHLWLIAGRAVPLIGVALLLPSLIFALAAARTRRWFPALAAALMLALAVFFVIAGNRWSMQLRRVWFTKQNHYYLVTDNQYLPPLDSMLDIYTVVCDTHDRHCESSLLMRFSSSALYYIYGVPDEPAFVNCDVDVTPVDCRPIYPLPQGTEIPYMPTPTP